MTTATTPETLQQIIEQMQEIQSQLIEAGGELTPEIEALIISAETRLEKKLDSYAATIDYLKGQADYLDRQAKLYTLRKKAIDNSIKSMRERMAFSMKAAGQEIIKTSAHTYSYRENNSWSMNEDLTKDDMNKLLERGLAEHVFKPSMA